MEFGKKLQELRKQKGLTQEELAQQLYVSRTAISKWESGRGYPNIDSLRAVAACFSVTVDQMLSGDQLLIIAQEDSRQKVTHTRDLVYGLLDLSTVSFLFLPLFRQTVNGGLQEVSLINLTTVNPGMQVAYLTIVMLMVLVGVLTLTVSHTIVPFWQRSKNPLSLILSGVGVLLLILGSQPYPATFLFLFAIIKTLLLLKK